MAIGATLGAVNSLYAIVDARRRELATLRAIGFRAAPIIASVLCESILLALPGALLWRAGLGTVQWPGGESLRLHLQSCGDPGPGPIGVVWALAMGFVGGLLPALRAGRVPVTTALRAT